MGAKVPVDVPYLITRYIKLHAMTDYSPLQVSIFTEPEAAAKWLDVSFELLTPRTSRKAA